MSQRCDQCHQPTATAPAERTGTNISTVCRRCQRRNTKQETRRSNNRAIMRWRRLMNPREAFRETQNITPA